MAIVIGARKQGKDIVYYAVVNGVASDKFYTGVEGRWQALAEAAEIERKALIKELASQEMAYDLASLPDGVGITIAVGADPASRYSFTDAEGNLYPEGFDSRDGVVDFTTRPAHPGEP